MGESFFMEKVVCNRMLLFVVFYHLMRCFFLQVRYLQCHRVCHALLAPLCQYLNQQNQSCHEKELQWIRSVSCSLLCFLVVVKFICVVGFHHFTRVEHVLNSCIMQGNFRLAFCMNWAGTHTIYIGNVYLSLDSRLMERTLVLQTHM